MHAFCCSCLLIMSVFISVFYYSQCESTAGEYCCWLPGSVACGLQIYHFICSCSYAYYNIVFDAALLAACYHKQIRDDTAIYSETFYTTPNDIVAQVKVSVFVTNRDGWIVIFCRILDSVNRRLISGRFRIRIWNFDVTLPLVCTYKNYSTLHPVLYFCNL